MHGAWYRTAGTALRDLFYFAVLSGNSAWRLFKIKQSCPTRKGTLLRQAPPHGEVIENGGAYSYDLPVLFQKVRRHAALPDKTTK